MNTPDNPQPPTARANKSYHMCLNIRGALKNWNKRQLGALLQNEDGTKVSAAEAREYLLDELQQGRSVLPMGECDHFDYQSGCLGHIK